MGRRLQSERGYVLITVLLLLALVGLLGSAAIDQTMSSLRMAVKVTEEEQALYAANAGMEHAVAYLQAGGSIESAPTLTGTLSDAPKLVTYSVTMTPSVTQPGLADVVSVGQAGSSTRRVTATAGSMTPTGYSKAIYHGQANFRSDIGNHVDICGDVYTVGDLDLGTGVTVHEYAPGESTKCPKGSSGTVISSGTISGNKSGIEGGWCDETHPTQGPCAATGGLPPIIPMPDPDLDEICSRPDAIIRTSFPGGTYGTYGQPTIYCSTSTAGVSFGGDIKTRGRVTFVATRGGIVIPGDATHDSGCSDLSLCTNAFMAKGAIRTTRTWAVIYGAIFTNDAGTGLSVKNHTEIHGSVIVSHMDLGTDVWIIADEPIWSAPPPGMPGAPGGPSLTGWSDSP